MGISNLVDTQFDHLILTSIDLHSSVEGIDLILVMFGIPPNFELKIYFAFL